MLCSLVHQVTLAQDDTPWWKRLFRKETVEELEQNEAERPSVEPEEVPADTIFTGETNDERPVSDSIAVPVLSRDKDGEITFTLPEGLERLDSLYLENPPQLMGYRVQVYFGRLQDAREERLEYLRSELPYPSYLIQNPPNFAVHLGDFRTELDAWKALQELKEAYPSAIVVPSEIEWPSVEAATEERIPLKGGR